ncbi:aromatic amino acid aminotransferase [Saccharata proteae CBS 121410]|uniref:Aromatic amino acid aminotransferase n=1 Tax=Saccharata proteae CBS 121410 TaxID=1314787 RepID=A0A9P4I1M6_9PEZI|nr:aromatic amino acid aminotransferase [Saccharata proteae CBS 121410]
MDVNMELKPPMDISHHLSRNAKSRVESSIKQFYKYFSIPGIGQLAGGLPNNNYFPFDNLESKVALPNRWTPTPNNPVDPPTAALKATSLSETPPSSHVEVPHDSKAPDVLRKIDLSTALQYGTAQGYPPLYQFVRQFTTQHLHPHIPYKGGAEIILTCGSTDGFSKVLQALNDEWVEGRDPLEEKEALLCEEFCYMNAVQTATPRGMNMAPVKIDDEGMCAEGPGGLRDVLENWDESKGRRPRLMYTVTIGQNPTSGTLSVQRRKELYALCDKYDVIIVEDDPYWYLQFPSSSPNHATFASLPTPTKSSGFPFLDSLVPSYLSIDTSGRVVRLDTFSKTVAPGCRLGWITAQPALIERILRITETSTQQPSGFVQSMIAELIIGPQAADSGRGGAKDGKGWAMAGWIRWLEGLRGNYERRMNAMSDVLASGSQLLKSGRRASFSALLDSPSDEDEWSVIETTPMYEFTRPLGGMFIWLTFNFASHPLANKMPGPRLARALWILWTTAPYKVLVSPGSIFAPSEKIRDTEAWKSFRLCFAACPEEEIVGISKRCVKGVQEFWRIRDVGRIEELLGDEDPGMEGEGMGMLAGFC